MVKQVYQLKITLLDSKPKIWRKIIVKPNISLFDLHKIVQVTMGWSNSHLYQFIHKKDFYMPKEFNSSEFDSNNTKKDSQSVKLNTILSKAKDKIIYEYDFGDSWGHEIVLEKIIEDEEKSQIPRCIDGARSCPPEDCGGIWGYMDLLEILSNPKSEEYEEMINWVGDDFDAEYFDVNEVNKILKKKNFGYDLL